MRKRSYSRIRR